MWTFRKNLLLHYVQRNYFQKHFAWHSMGLYTSDLLPTPMLPPPMPPLCDLNLAMYQPLSIPRTSTPRHLLTHAPTPFFSTPSKRNRDPKSAHYPATPPGQPSEHHKVNNGAKSWPPLVAEQKWLKMQLLKTMWWIWTATKRHHKPRHWVKALSRMDKVILTNGKWLNDQHSER